MNASNSPIEIIIRALAFAIGAFVGIYGLWCLFSVDEFARMLGITAYQGQIAPVEFRAGYGGMQAGLGAALAWAALQRRWWPVGVCVMTIWAGSLLAGRVYGVVVDNPVLEPDGYTGGALLFEFFTTAFGLLALLFHRRRASRSE